MKRGKKESEELVEEAKNVVKEPKCVVDFEIDSVGAITAMVYGENGVKKVDLCYNDDTSKRKGAYMLRARTPDSKKILKAYCNQTGKSIEKAKFNDEGFINWMREYLKMDSNKQWETTHASWTGYDVETYETKLDALSSLLSGEAFGLGVNVQDLEQNQPQ